MYARESWARGKIPVFSYYMLLQSRPGGGDEAHADLANLRNAATMKAYWADVRLLFERIKGDRPLVVHVEPDLWGYLEQANAVGLASRFAQEWIRLRNTRGLLRPRRRLLRAGGGQPADVVHGGRLPPAPALRTDVRPARRDPDGRVADPARQHVASGHLGPLSRQPRPVVARRLARPPARVRGRRRDRVPLRRRRRRDDERRHRRGYFRARAAAYYRGGPLRLPS